MINRLRVLVALILTISLSDAAIGEIKGYQVDNSQPFTWHSVSTAYKFQVDQFIGGIEDGYLNEVELPFVFKFYEGSYSKISINTKGVIIFGEGDYEYLNRATPLNYIASPRIAALWDDWSLRGSSESGIFIETLGISPNREFVITWNDIRRYDSDDNKEDAGHISFQVVLSEGSNTISINYKEIRDAGPYTGGAGATVGLHFSTKIGQTFFLNGLFYPSKIEGLIDEQSSLRFSPVAIPSCDPNASDFELLTPENGTRTLTKAIFTAQLLGNSCSPEPILAGEITAQVDGFITQLNDLGENGDQNINDGIYSAFVNFNTAGKKTVVFTGNSGSNVFLQKEVQLNVEDNRYKISNVPFEWISTDDARILTFFDATDDDSLTLLSPFNIKIFGREYSTIGINSNGAISFDSEFSSNINKFMPYESLDIPFLAAFWDDLDLFSFTAHILVGEYGSSPNRKFVVTWQEAHYFDHFNSDVSVQVVFYETTGAIRINYKNVNSDELHLNAGKSATIGIQEGSFYGETYFKDGVFIESGSQGEIQPLSSILFLPPGASSVEPTPTAVPTSTPTAVPTPSHTEIALGLVSQAEVIMMTAKKSLLTPKGKDKGSKAKAKSKNAPILQARRELILLLKSLLDHLKISANAIEASYKGLNIENATAAQRKLKAALSKRADKRSVNKAWKNLSAILKKIKLQG